MREPNRRREKYVIGPDGSPLTMASLPPPDTERWVVRRKAEVVAAIRGGLLSIDEACDRYKLSTEELLTWQDSLDRHGLAGLRTTQIQKYRPAIEPIIGKPVADEKRQGSKPGDPDWDWLARAVLRR